MKALIVGAGAVGQVYARHLALGGAEVSLYVRPRYADEARRGFALYPLDRPAAERRAAAVRFRPASVLTSAEEVARERFDAVLLCVSSTALRAGDWVGPLARAAGDATIVSFTPGIEDREYLAGHVPEARLATGLIPLISYQAPLPGEVVAEPGVAYWMPPLAEISLEGPAGRAEAVAAAFRRGGFRSAVRADLQVSLAFASTVVSSFVASLERSGWKFAAYRSGDGVPLTCRAAREKMDVVARRFGARRPLWSAILLRPFVASLLVRAATRLVPLDLETYLRYHFTKVGDQTREGIRTYLDLARRYGIETPALRELAAALGVETKNPAPVKEAAPCT